MKQYLFKYMDKYNNLLTSKTLPFCNIKQARECAKVLLAESMQADLKKIKVELMK